MLNSTDFDTDVPEFTNGTYASTPLSSTYVAEPGSTDYLRGVEPLSTLPAQWWNWFMQEFTSRFNFLNIFVGNLFDELTNLLALMGLTPDGTTTSETSSQLSNAFENYYPHFLSKFIHTIASVWTYTGTSTSGDVTTTQSTRLAVYEHINESDASTSPAAETDTYNTKYVEKLPIELGGTNADNEQDAMDNLASGLSTSSAMNTGDELMYRDASDSTVKTATVTTLSNAISQVTDPRIVKASTPRWLRFDFDEYNDSGDKQTLFIVADTRITYPGGTFNSGSSGYSKNMLSNMVTSAGSSYNGADFYVYVVPDSTSTYGGEIVCSSLSDAPTDIDSSYTSSVVLKIGRFHTLCADVNSPTMILPASPSSGLTTSDYVSVKSYTEEDDSDFYNFYRKQITTISTGTYYDVVTVSHPLAGFEAGDILPESVWCLSFKPSATVEDAIVYDRDTDRAIDIYLQMGTGFNTRSSYSTSTKPTCSRAQPNHLADMRAVGKVLISDEEFSSAALGSNECTNIYGSASVNSSGGHVDTASRRMISAIGCEDMCGFLSQWTRNVSAGGSATGFNGSSWIGGGTSPAWTTTDGQSKFGMMYGAMLGLRAGGYWGNGSYCGSRCRNAHSAVSRVDAAIGGRGSSRVIRNS